MSAPLNSAKQVGSYGGGVSAGAWPQRALSHACLRSWWLRGLCLVAAVVLGALAFPPRAHAAERAPRLLILRSGESESFGELAKKVDAQLEHALVASGFPNTYFSPTSFEEVELAAGCDGGPTPECLRRVSSTIDADWVLVRKLERDENGALKLVLVAQDGAQSVLTRRALGHVTAAGAETPEHVVPQLVHMLYPTRAGSSDPAVDLRVPEPEHSREQQNRAIAITGWSALATAGVLLGSGLGVGVAGTHDEQRYRRLDVRDPQSASHAASLLDRAKTRTHVANGLIIGGAALGVASGALLVWDVLRKRDDARPLRVALRPGRSGGMITLAGTFGGGR